MDSRNSGSDAPASVPEIAIASAVLRNSLDSLSRSFVAKEVGHARDTARQTARTGGTLDEVKSDLAGARDALTALSTRIGSARLVAATIAGVAPGGTSR